MTKNIDRDLTTWFPRLMAMVGVAIGLGLILWVRPPTEEITGKTVVELWYTTGADESKPQAPVWFNETQDRIHVKRVGLPFIQIEQKFLTSVVGNVSPDLFEYFGSVAQWSSRGALIPLDGFMDRDGFDRNMIFATLWPEVTWEGEVYAIPTGVGCDAFYWNKKHFREAGLDPDRPPPTWAELEEYAERLTLRDEQGQITRPGYIPGYWSAMSALGNPVFLFWALEKDPQFLSADGRKVNLTSPACVEALEWETRLFKKLGGEELIAIRSSYGYGTQHGFLSGQLSMIAQKSSFVQEIQKFAPDLEYGASLFPVPEGGHPATTLGPVWIGIPAGAKHPEEAWEYIRFYTQTATQLRVAAYAIDRNQAAFFPANIEAARSPKQMSTPFMEVFLDSMKWGTTPTVIPLAHSVFWREYANAWDYAVRGQKSPREALEEAEEQIQRALDSQLDYNDFYTRRRAQLDADESPGEDDLG